VRFREHAIERFAERRHMSLLAAELESRRSYRMGRMCTRREAMGRIAGGIARGRRYDHAYRTDGTGPGVWILAQSYTGAWWAVTYLHPGDDFEQAEREVAVAAAGL